MKFHLISLGCSKNTADSEAIGNRFLQRGWSWTKEAENADLLLINTCGFIKDAKEQSLLTIMKALEAKNCKPGAKVAAFGCLIKRYHKEVKEQIPELDYLFEFLSDDDIQFLTNLRPGGAITERDFSKSWRFFTPPHIGILKIAEGCSNRCSYCAIPGIRGPFASRSEKEILQDAKKLAASGAVEISVVAQDITRYGTDINGSCDLPNLVEQISSLSGVKWIRLHYMHPRGLSKQLISQLFTIPKVLPYFDIPFQHASDRMLRLMNRHTSPEHLIDLIRYIRRNFRQAAIRTTFIVGFPGENEEDFEELIDFIERFPLDRVGAFAYSTEEGTSAAMIVPKVANHIKQARLDQLMTLQQLLIEERNRKLVGKKLSVLIDRVEDDIAFGRTQWDAYEVDNRTIISNCANLNVGQIVPCRITQADAYDFRAEPI